MACVLNESPCRVAYYLQPLRAGGLVEAKPRPDGKFLYRIAVQLRVSA